MKLICLSLLICLLHTTTAFWSSGHLIISRIAYNELKAKNSTMFAFIGQQIALLKQFSNEKDHGFVEAAVWADDNKEIEFNQFTPWHYADTPYVQPDFSGDIEIENMNVTWAINEMKKTLSNKNEPQFDNGLALSFAWRYLLHLVGDLHQPLHATSMYSKQFPDGDMGGNLFLIEFDDPEISNLHALWDACVGQYGSIYAPVSEQEWTNLGLYASQVTSNFTRTDVKDRLAITDPKKWAAESYSLAKDIVYNLNPGDTISEEYLAVGRKVINEQLAVGGYRLADLLETLVLKSSDSIIENLLKNE